MVGRRFRIVLAVVAVLALCRGGADAQSLGSYRWQLVPYCNVVTLSATQDGSVFTLDGYDDQCGAGTRASAAGTAFVNPNGSIGIGLTIVSAPSGAPVHVEASIILSTLSGTWHDNHGNSGSFVFTPGAPGAGAPRPLSAVGAGDINPAEVQRRIAASCPTGQLMTGVGEDGSVACEATPTGAGGDITGVSPGTGLAGGGTSGDVTLRVLFAGTGILNAAAKGDHHHGVGGVTGANTAIGEQAFEQQALSSSHNTAIGFRAGYGGGSRNTAVGSRALNESSTTSDNTAIGHQALADAQTGSSFNTALGSDALAELATGQNNVALGKDALTNLASGTGSIAIGRSAGVNLTNGSNNIYLGHLGNATEDDTIRLGSAGHSRTFVGGIRGITTGANNAVAVVVDGAGQLGTVSSSRRTKFDIADLAAPVTATLHRLRPVQFRYRQAFANGSTPIQYGLIAEEVQEVLPDLVAVDGDGQATTVKYHILPSLLLADVQRLEHERQRLDAALTAERSRVTDLERRFHDQARVLDDLRASLARMLPR